MIKYVHKNNIKCNFTCLHFLNLFIIIFLGLIKYGLEQLVSLDINAHSLSIKNFVDLKTNVDNNENVEVAMHINSSNNVDEGDNEELFFTDLNNFQVSFCFLNNLKF